MKTTNFDAVAASAPLNRNASVIRDGSGDLWEAKINETQKHWSAPPLPLAKRPAHHADITGLKVGRLTVVRYHGKHPKDGHWWLVRCTCGDYEVRNSKFLTKPKPRGENWEHTCAACDYLEHIKWKAAHEGSGIKRAAADEAFLDRIAAGERPA